MSLLWMATARPPVIIEYSECRKIPLFELLGLPAFE